MLGLRVFVAVVYGALSGVGFLVVLVLCADGGALLPFLELDDAGVGQAVRMFAEPFAVAGALAGALMTVWPVLQTRAKDTRA